MIKFEFFDKEKTKFLFVFQTKLELSLNKNERQETINFIIKKRYGNKYHFFENFQLCKEWKENYVEGCIAFKDKKFEKCIFPYQITNKVFIYIGK